MGNSLISIASYRQMIGRAGRTNLDASGESYLMMNSQSKLERDHAVHIMSSDLEPLNSNLHLGYGGGIEKLLLELMSCDYIQTEDDVNSFISETLFSKQYSSIEVDSRILKLLSICYI